MNTLNLRNINLHSPYMVGQTDENDSSFYLFCLPTLGRVLSW